MAPILIDGKKISAQIKEEVKEEVLLLQKKGVTPCLAVIQVGNDPASSVYVRNKRKACEYTGIRFVDYLLPEDTDQQTLFARIQALNEDPSVHGILVQLPLPEGIDEKAVTRAILPSKDVDGFHPDNAGALFLGEKGFVSCTPAGILQLLKRSGIEIEGKECVVLGRSNIVGKPMAALLLQENGTVTITHSRTRNLREVTRRADILVVAVGKPCFVDDTFVKEGAVVIDVGIHRNGDNKLCGDVDFEKTAPKCSAITPVPGGVGPMTVAMLMKNCVEAAEEAESDI
ncbi:MAG: bifunctional methylenetetrahydrofolate dehydrogenase/methenyltetrahydrofolate cyclohydrolase FolD [Lachnospiraceae bacterium]|nr:bifunctional methylenetetrahydrofolate dehydrogenase/methenyltetrahydrofolate cyclohydrolase FolD [Lachnospiraceae bacterium]